ncbi:KR domain-containing protein [Aspergillus falconensis]
MAVDTVGIIEKIGHGVMELCPGDTVLVQSANIQNPFCEDALNVVKVPTDLSPVQVVYWMSPLACAYYLLTEIGNVWSSPLAQYKSVSSTRVHGQYTPPRSQPLGVHQRLQSILIDVEGPALRHALVQVTQWLLLDIFVVIPPGDPQQEAVGCKVHSSRRGDTRSIWDDPENVPHMLSSLTHNGHLVAVDTDPEADVASGLVMPRGFTNFVSLYTTQIDPSSLRDAQRAALRLLANGTIVLPEMPTNAGAWHQPVSRVDKIFQRSSSSSASGRIVLSFEPSHCLPLRFSVPAPVQLAPAGTYILSGVLGVLGQQIAHWLCNDHGARHLVFLSRSGALTPAASETLRVLSQQGCRCDVVRCDITSTEAVQTLASTATKKNWSIRDIIQAAMVLADSPLETMDSAKWEAAAAPKIRGSWNLHQFLGSEDLASISRNSNWRDVRR